MTHTIADRVKETTDTTGTGTYNLDGASSGFQSFVAGVGTTNTCTYCCTDNTDWEVGVGTVTDAATDTLSRDTILASSNSGAAVNWGAGTKTIFCTVPAEAHNFTAFPSSQTTNPTSTGTGSFAIGDGADATANYTIAIGHTADASATLGTAIGYGALCAGGQSISIGYNANVESGGLSNIAIGESCNIDNAGGNVGASTAIGYWAKCNAGAYGAVAIGSGALAGGDDSTALNTSTTTAQDSFAWGDSTANGQYSQAGARGITNGNYSLAWGFNSETTSGALYSFAWGRYASAYLYGQHAISLNRFTVDGDQQYSKIGFAGTTTNATETEIHIDLTTGRAVLPASRTWLFKILMVARQTAGTAGTVGDSWGHIVEGVIKRDGANNTSLVGSVTDTTIAEDTGATSWAVAVTADDTNESLKVAVTGEADKTIHWVAKCELIEVG